MQSFTMEEINKMAEREWADSTHEHVGSSESDGHDFSSDTIGGCYGIDWYEVYEIPDGSHYVVHCYDGVNRSKGVFKPKKRWEEEEPTHTNMSKGFTFGEIMNSRSQRR